MAGWVSVTGIPVGGVERLTMTSAPVLRSLDAVTLPVPDLDQGLAFYEVKLGHELLWRNDAVGQAGLALPDSGVELVLTTQQRLEPNWLVESIDDAVEKLVEAGATVAAEPAPIPVGQVAVVIDPFGNPLVLVQLTDRYASSDGGSTPA
jgi:predicted enzyme related to lactoylglutathione lyase